MKLDHDSLVSGILASSVHNMAKRHDRSRIIRGLSGGENYATSYRAITYPRVIDRNLWTEDEVRVFHGEHSAVSRAVLSVFASDYITNAIKVGFYNAMLRKKDYRHPSQLYTLNYYMNKLGD